MPRYCELLLLELLLCTALLRVNFLFWTCRIRNPDIPRAVRFRAARGGAAVGIWSTEIRSRSFNVLDKRASQPASRQLVHAVVGEQCAVAEEAEQQSGGAGRSTGPFPADLIQGPLQRKVPERLGRGRGAA